MNNNIQLVILDFDGTLADTRSLIVRTMQQTICELSLPPRTDGQCAAMIGLPLKETFTKLIDMSDAMGDKCAETYTRLFFENNRPGAVPVFPHVVETIKALHDAGIQLTIASSRGRDTLVEFLREMKMEQYISFVICATDIERAKPDPDMVLVTLRRTGIAPQNAIVVGDTTFDILMAHRAGVRAVGVTYGNGTRQEMESLGTEYIIDSFDALCGIVLGRWANRDNEGVS